MLACFHYVWYDVMLACFHSAWYDVMLAIVCFRYSSSKYALEDVLKVPADIPAGDYVLSYRWDCEMTSQIWQSCSDITIE